MVRSKPTQLLKTPTRKGNKYQNLELDSPNLRESKLDALFSTSMNRLLSSERSKWLFVIGLIAIGVGFTTKNVISYPSECAPGGATETSLDLKKT